MPSFNVLISCQLETELEVEAKDKNEAEDKAIKELIASGELHAEIVVDDVQEITEPNEEEEGK